MKDSTLLLLAGGVALLLAGTKKTTPTHGGPVNTGKVSPTEREIIIRSIAAFSWPQNEIETVIQIESGWKTSAVNPVSFATGLIQLMPRWLRDRQFHPELDNQARARAFAALSAAEQLPWILEYFREVGRRWNVPGDTYMAVAAPAFVGAPDDAPIYPENSPAWKQNPAWRPSSGSGPITAGSIRAFFLKRLPKGEA